MRTRSVDAEEDGFVANLWGPDTQEMDNPSEGMPGVSAEDLQSSPVGDMPDDEAGLFDEQLNPTSPRDLLDDVSQDTLLGKYPANTCPPDLSKFPPAIPATLPRQPTSPSFSVPTPGSVQPQSVVGSVSTLPPKSLPKPPPKSSNQPIINTMTTNDTAVLTYLPPEASTKSGYEAVAAVSSGMLSQPTRDASWKSALELSKPSNVAYPNDKAGLFDEQLHPPSPRDLLDDSPQDTLLVNYPDNTCPPAGLFDEQLNPTSPRDLLDDVPQDTLLGKNPANTCPPDLSKFPPAIPATLPHPPTSPSFSVPAPDSVQSQSMVGSVSTPLPPKFKPTPPPKSNIQPIANIMTTNDSAALTYQPPASTKSGYEAVPAVSLGMLSQPTRDTSWKPPALEPSKPTNVAYPDSMKTPQLDLLQVEPKPSDTKKVIQMDIAPDGDVAAPSSNSPIGERNPVLTSSGIVDGDQMSCTSNSSCSFDSDVIMTEETQFVPVDMEFLRTTIQSGMEEIENISGQDVVLVVGKTGVGKSTFIQGIAGKKLRATTHIVTSEDETFQIPVFEADDPLQGFEIGHEKKSKTQTIKSFRDENSGLVYLDSPGFEDTNGFEVDIATSVMLSKVAKHCRTLRFVVLINFASFLEDRGGAICSILKFTRAFVKDFNKEKKSFLFLFTHTNEIREIPDSIEGAKQYLLKEIVQVLEGISDEDAKVVLSFMRKSLKKQSRFVNVFHPLKSDFTQTTLTIQKMKALKDPAVAANCGLTPTSQLKIHGEARTMLLGLQRMLSQSSVPIGQVKETHDSLSYLGEHIGTPELNRVACESHDAIGRCCAALKKTLDEEVERGTDAKHSFSIENVRSYVDCVRQLHSLSGEPLASVHRVLAQKLKAFENSITSEKPCLRFGDAPLKLMKLKAWADVYPQLHPTLERVQSHYQSELDQATQHTMELAPIGLDKLSREHRCRLLRHLVVLKSIADNEGPLVECGLVAEGARAVLPTILCGIDKVLTSWQEEAISTGGTFEALASRVECLHDLMTLLGDVNVGNCRERFEETVVNLEALAVRLFTEIATPLTDCQFPFDETVVKQFRCLGRDAAYFREIPGTAGREILKTASTVLTKLHSRLMGADQELTALSSAIERRGIFNGRTAATLLCSLVACTALDELFPPKYRFIGSCAIKHKRTYEDRVAEVERQVDNILSTLVSRNRHSVNLSELGELLAEVEQISEFLTCCGMASSTTVCIQNKLKEHTSNARDRINACLKRWATAARDGKKCKKESKTLNKYLAEVEDLVRALDRISYLKEVVSSCQAWTTDCHRSISNVLDHEKFFKGDYIMLSHRLNCLEELVGLSRFPNVQSTFEQAKQKAITVVSADAQRLKELASTGSNWSEFDQGVERFKKAKVLDPYIENGATRLLKELQDLRQELGCDNDMDELKKLLSNRQYKTIDKFLEPITGSAWAYKNGSDNYSAWAYENGPDNGSAWAYKNGRLSKFRKEIVASFKERIVALQQLLKCAYSAQRVEAMALSFQELQEAKRCLGGHLRPLFTDFQKLKRPLLLNKFKELTHAFYEASKKSDFAQMGLAQHRVGFFHQNLCQFLPDETEKEVETTRLAYTEKLKSVPRLLDGFFKSNFTDGTELLQALRSLKAGTDGDQAIYDISEVYESVVESFPQRLADSLQEFENAVQEELCYEDGIVTLGSLARQFEAGLKDHVKMVNTPFDIGDKLKEWRSQQQSSEGEINLNGEDDRAIRKLSKRMDKLKNPVFAFAKWVSGGATYEKICKQLESTCMKNYREGLLALESRDCVHLQSCIVILEQVDNHLGGHIKSPSRLVKELHERTVESFLSQCDQLVSALETGETNSFMGLFHDYRNFLVNIPSVAKSTKAQSRTKLVHQLIFKLVNSHVETVLNMLTFKDECFDFVAIKSATKRAREVGNFVADHFSLLHEDLKRMASAVVDSWIDKISVVCWKYFNHGRDLGSAKFFATLGLTPSATKEEIKRAYHSKAKEKHPDKHSPAQAEVASAEFRVIQEAFEVLTDASEKNVILSRPFDDELKMIGPTLRRLVRKCLSDQQYNLVGDLLFQLPHLHELESLVVDELKSAKAVDAVKDIVRDHVKEVKVDVESNWSDRKYAALNDNMLDLKALESSFKCYHDIFPNSWNNGIIAKIEEEITSLGAKARALLCDELTAKQHEVDFRQCFLQMGFVMVELPHFKAITKNIMSNVLATCLAHDWGYAYVFELGIRLRCGNEDSEEGEARVAHIILSEFSHFKEVMTMVWNQETVQKPAEVTVKGILARSREDLNELQIDRDALLSDFGAFEREYQTLLGIYLQPDADLKALTNDVQTTCSSLKPVACEDGWTPELKSKMPRIIAGVFAYFTVNRSGISFQRLGTSEDSAKLAEQVLMKPHNIQVLTILHMFGCGNPGCASLESQLMQIRTGEGKSMILGAAATVLGLLGFKVRCVCYSEYLSQRDYALFEEVFDAFGVSGLVKYSKITTLSEDTTAAKGDIRSLTRSLLLGDLGSMRHHVTTPTAARGLQNSLVPKGPKFSKQDPTSKKEGQIGSSALNKDDGRVEDGVEEAISHSQQEDGTLLRHTDRNVLNSIVPTKRSPPDNSQLASQSTRKHHKPTAMEEILLVDEVDVFFGAEFYGQTYNQVAELAEPEVAAILRFIWETHQKGGRHQKLEDVKALNEYKSLTSKIPGFEYLFDNEILLMLDQVRRDDKEPYFLDDNDRIGYKVMDGISYDAKYGYRTAFAYLEEAENGNLKDSEGTLRRVLTMPVSCGQFSYAEISPTRILGVSGTLEAMGQFEREVLGKYGVNTFVFVPSVYGASNFKFDKAGDGVSIESSVSDYFHKICSEVSSATKQGRAVIVFFRDILRLKEFESSAFYRRLGRQKARLTEDMSGGDKEFVIKKAATAGQVTVCTAVFGRGTDFFCKDERVLKSGGVHIVQTFLSSDTSEEIQVQGRTARQGKDGTYQLVLLESDLDKVFGILAGEKDKTPRKDWYPWLCQARDRHHDQHCKAIEQNLQEATSRDERTHEYFDSLLVRDQSLAAKLFEEIYLSMKKQMPAKLDIDLAVVVDITGSMGPYTDAVGSSVKALVNGSDSICSKLKQKFPEIEFSLRMGSLGFRDVDDGTEQFREIPMQDGSRFTKDASEGFQCLKKILQDHRGGYDVAEDHLGAIDQCLKWNGPEDWQGHFKFMMLLTDAPNHGMVPDAMQGAITDNHAVCHPSGLTVDDIVSDLVSSDVQLIFCSFNPPATAKTEETLSNDFVQHPDNLEGREVISIPMVPKTQQQQQTAGLSGGDGQHIIFVLDESGSMSYEWPGVVEAYRRYLKGREESQCISDLVSVVQFDNSSRVTVNQQPISSAPQNLNYSGGATCFSPPACDARNLALGTPSSHTPVVVFMSDGKACDDDARQAANTFVALNGEINARSGCDLEIHVVAFGGGVSRRQLEDMSQASPKGRIYTSNDAAELTKVFVDIAKSTENVVGMLEAEIGRRISDAVSEKLALEYTG